MPSNWSTHWMLGAGCLMSPGFMGGWSISCNLRPDFLNIQSMAASESNPSAEAPPAQVFVTTHWSVVLAAARSDTPRAQAALEHLCRIYWYPIYYFVRRQGHSMHDAQDFTQEFFARLLEKNWLGHADQSRGRFRSFLLLVLKRFLAVEWHKANAQKRAGDRHCLPLPLDTAETRYVREPADTELPRPGIREAMGAHPAGNRPAPVALGLRAGRTGPAVRGAQAVSHGQPRVAAVC